MSRSDLSPEPVSPRLPARYLPAACLVAVALAAGAAAAAAGRDPVAPSPEYWAYVCSESEDVVSLLRFGVGGLELVREIPVGTFPSEIEAPHGIAVEPGGRHWFVSMAHGRPFGSVHKYEAGSDLWLAEVEVGMFPASMDVAASTGLLYVANFDLHGDPEPSTVSVVETGTMLEVARIESGVMPHGARLDPRGRHLYTVSMAAGELLEIDALRFEVVRRLPLAHGPAAAEVRPTWVTPPSPAGRVYVAGNGTDTVYEVDVSAWQIERRFAGAGRGPYNVAVASPRLLVVTYKRSGEVGFWSLDSGLEVTRSATSRRIPHGVATTGDGRLAWVTAEGIGEEPGTVEVYDLGSFARVAAIDVGKQAGGIALWRPTRR